MTRYRVVVVLDLADDDQSDEEAIVDCVKSWVHNGMAEDFRQTEIHWPPRGPAPDNDPHYNVSVEIPHGWGARHIRKEGMDL